VKTLAELVAYDKANPGKLAWATDGLKFHRKMAGG
jgi:tripartite-type tricarboxylate transporter receptor subunit TctC